MLLRIISDSMGVRKDRMMTGGRCVVIIMLYLVLMCCFLLGWISGRFEIQM